MISVMLRAGLWVALYVLGSRHSAPGGASVMGLSMTPRALGAPRTRGSHRTLRVPR